MEEKGKREKRKVRARVRGKEGKKKSSLARKEKKLSLSLFATRKNEKYLPRIAPTPTTTMTLRAC